MAKLPPAAVVTVTEKARTGLDVLKRNVLSDCVRTDKSAVELETGKVAFDYLVADPDVSPDFNPAIDGDEQRVM